MGKIYLYADNRYVLNQTPYPIALGPGFFHVLERLAVGAPVVAVYSFPLNLFNADFKTLHTELNTLEGMLWDLKKKCSIQAVLLDCETWYVKNLPDDRRRFEIITIQNRLYSLFYGVTYNVETKTRSPIYWYRYGDSMHFKIEMTLGELSVRGYMLDEVRRAVNNPQVRNIFISLGFDYVLRSELPDWVPGDWTGYRWSGSLSIDPKIQHQINNLSLWDERAVEKARLVKNWPYDITIYPNPVHVPRAYECFMSAGMFRQVD